MEQRCLQHPKFVERVQPSARALDNLADAWSRAQRFGCWQGVRTGQGCGHAIVIEYGGHGGIVQKATLEGETLVSFSRSLVRFVD